MKNNNDLYEIIKEKDREIERLRKELEAEKDKNFMLNNKLLQLERKPEMNHLSYHTTNKISHPIKKIATKPSNIVKPKVHSVKAVRKGKIQTESMLKNVIVEKRLKAFVKENDDDAPVNNRINVLRDSRIPEDATYEELLYLEKKIGDVSKGLSNNELNRIKVSKYVAGKKKEQCLICLSEFKDKEEIRNLYCNHFFHRKCIDNWLKINKTCPLCKEIAL